jgi:hypothetical protein
MKKWWETFKFGCLYFEWLVSEWNPCNMLEKPLSPILVFGGVERVAVPVGRVRQRYVPTNKAVFDMFGDALTRNEREYQANLNAIEGKVVDPFQSLYQEYGRRE